MLGAPPAGFMNLVQVFAHNAAATLTLACTISDDDGNQTGAFAFAAGTDQNFMTTPNSPLVVTSALVANVFGGTGGTPCEFRVMYIQLPIPTGMKKATLVMTNAFQAIPLGTITQTMHGYRIVPQYENSNQGLVIFDGDTANIGCQMRLTRGAQVFTFVAFPAASSGGRSAPPQVTLLAGDTLEAKLLVAPAVAGSVILRAIYVPS